MARLCIAHRRWCTALSLLLVGLVVQAYGEMVNEGIRAQDAAAARARECCENVTPDVLYSLAHVDTVAPLQEGLMLAPFNSEWRRHDGFGLLAITCIVVVAIVAGVLVASR